MGCKELCTCGLARVQAVAMELRVQDIMFGSNMIKMPHYGKY